MPHKNLIFGGYEKYVVVKVVMVFVAEVAVATTELDIPRSFSGTKVKRWRFRKKQMKTNLF